jgi:hypothetical protein
MPSHTNCRSPVADWRYHRGVLVPALLLSILVVFLAVTVGLPIWVSVREVRRQAGWRTHRAQVLREGLAAEASVLSVGPSNRGKFYLSLRLEVHADDRVAAFSASVIAYVPDYAQSAVAPGQRVKVRYLPQDRSVEVDLAAMGYEVRA